VSDVRTSAVKLLLSQYLSEKPFKNRANRNSFEFHLAATRLLGKASYDLCMATKLKPVLQYPMSFIDAMAALFRVNHVPSKKKKEPKAARSLTQASIRP